MSLEITLPEAYEALFRQRQRQRTYYPTEPGKPIFVRERYDEYKTETLIREPVLHFDLGEEPGDYWLISNNILHKVIPVETEVENKKLKIVDTYYKLDKTARFLQGFGSAPNLIFLIDFSRPYDGELFRKLVDPADAYEGIVDYSAEGIPQPSVLYTTKIAKIKINPGQTVYIRVPLICAYRSLVYVFMNVYVPSGIKCRHYIVIRTYSTYKDYIFPVELEGDNKWARIGVAYRNESRVGSVMFEVYFRNDASTIKYIYVSLILVRTASPVEAVNRCYWTVYFFDDLKVTITNTTITFNLPAYYLFPNNRKIILDHEIRMAGDGTNAITFEFQVDGVTLYSVSTSSTTVAEYGAQINVDARKYIYNVTFKFSTPGTGYIYRVWLNIIVAENFAEYPKRDSGSYTSDGDGVTDTVTLLDYTQAVSHIKKLLRVKATGDTNTTLLQLKVDGNVVWDFLNDGNECVLDIERVRKVELLVNDPGGGTTTTVNYVVQFVEENSHLVK